MLLSLDIANYALIDRQRVDFDNGFTVITGETGAGKSIILDAVNLLLGQRADSKAIRAGQSKCTVEGRFDISSFALKPFFEKNDLDYFDNECILRREIYDTGRSRAFINDVPTSLTLMKELGNKLIDIHSQNQNMQLNSEDYQLSILDTVAHDEEALANYSRTFEEWRNAKKELQKAQEKLEHDKADYDYLSFQVGQFAEAKLRDGEQEELEQEQDTLSHAEEIKEALYDVENILSSDDGGLLSGLKECYSRLNGISHVFAPSKSLAERLDSALIELKDILCEIQSFEEGVEFSPERLQEVADRLNTLYSLQQKHHVSSVAELLELSEQFSRRLNDIDTADDRIEELKRQEKSLCQKLSAAAADVTDCRRQASEEVERYIVDSLNTLGMPNVRFSVELSGKKDFGANGADAVRFLFSANKSSELQDISRVASGGEISRVMLAVKSMIARSRQLPTIVFDEIDTGVSGEIAARMANVMSVMSRSIGQVICITHLPQIAAKGNTHFKVSKKETEKGTVSSLNRLDKPERIEEIAHMLSGTEITEAALNNAKALLNND